MEVFGTLDDTRVDVGCHTFRTQSLQGFIVNWAFMGVPEFPNIIDIGPHLLQIGIGGISGVASMQNMGAHTCQSLFVI